MQICVKSLQSVLSAKYLCRGAAGTLPGSRLVREREGEREGGGGKSSRTRKYKNIQRLGQALTQRLLHLFALGACSGTMQHSYVVKGHCCLYIFPKAKAANM